MTILFILLLLTIYSGIALISWTTIHELSHFLMAKLLIKARLIKLQIFPGIDKKYGWRWGYCAYESDVAATPKQEAVILFAPRIAGFIAAVLLPIAGLMGELGAFLVWTAFFAPGLFDTVNGSIGRSQYSDLSRACANLKVSKWGPRIIGFGIVLASIAGWVIMSSRYLMELLIRLFG